MEEQNFGTLITFLNAMEVREDDETFQNPIDQMFEALEKKEPDHFAVRQYRLYKLAAGKTAKSILISCGARLAPFDIAELREITRYDELELDTLAVMGMIVLMLPLFFLAMYEKDGQPLEAVARHFIQAKFIRPKVRPYATNNYYSALMRQDQVEKEVQAIVQNAEKRARESGASRSPRKPDKSGKAAGQGHHREGPQG